jgi:predicted nuclease of predicted toxin-antitoxin system
VKFIVDAQLPIALSYLLKHRGYDAIHTMELPDSNASSDELITSITIQENRIVITKDNNFLESYLINAKPKKLLLVKTGNINNKALIALFDSNLTLIVEMLTRNNLVELTTTLIIEHE